MQALVIRISRDVHVLDITVNIMLNKRKGKKAAGASPQTGSRAACNTFLQKHALCNSVPHKILRLSHQH